MELAKGYEPEPAEGRRYAEWLRQGYFGATPGHRTPYCITIPPPNITGSLHCGHALNPSIMDCLIRWRRMCGDNVLCLPGTDHAGIATQAVVERKLAEEGLSRHDLGREAFVKRCWEWREQYGDRIIMQLQRLGCSYDWSRTRFTLDESYVAAIYEEFLRWWDRGLIYRGARVVNWCPRCSSAISDIEVSPEERQGALYHVRYPLVDGSGHITVATTRPETMLGDTAIAVNPDDERYTSLVGSMARLPLADRVIPIVADSYARMDFGTGAVKVTPAHDLDDFEAGLRNNLPQIKVIGDDGCMTADAGSRYAGLGGFECRRQVLDDLASAGLLERTEPYTVKVPLCDRCKAVLEPLLSEQWFVRQSDLAGPAIEAIESGRIRFVPDRYARICLDWLHNIRDWCISRQLWWGHRIPVWWTADGRCMAGRNAEDAAARLGAPVAELSQDEDVLDTWFSSALWPHATLGWPRQTKDLEFWYPTSLLSTAQEIIYLWVARMAMTGLDFLGEVPFRDVYIHATVLDANGERMSKSKGNGVDPLDMIDRYGADALRFSLLQQAGKNQDFRFMEERVRLGKAFINKLWNASRFVLSNAAEASKTERQSLTQVVATRSLAGVLDAPVDLWDRWILSRLQATTLATTQGLAGYDMDDAARALYAFVWDEFCDWYLEISKGRMRDDDGRMAVLSVLVHCLDSALRLLHPMIPHVTEEIWGALHETLGAKSDEGPSLMAASYPESKPILVSAVSEDRASLVMEVVRAVRNLRAEFGVAPGVRLTACAVPAGREQGLVLSDNASAIAGLARLGSIGLADSRPSGDGWASCTIGGSEVFVEIGAALDLDRERERLEKGILTSEAEMERSRARLSNEQFVSKAPEAVVAKERAALDQLTEKVTRLREKKEALAALCEGRGIGNSEGVDAARKGLGDGTS
ncbi:MAG: valine--tRNA ligase [Armatimonadetes bacterium]|nr:valine--tRNA ligase [Armatimonadota bacterium]